MLSALKSSTAFTTFNFAGKTITVLISVGICAVAFLYCSLVKHCTYLFKILMADNRLMMVLAKETITLTIIDVTVKTAVTVGLLKNHITCVLFVVKNGVHCARTPFTAPFCLDATGIQFPGYRMSAFTCKAGCKNLFNNLCLLRHNNHRTIIVFISVWWIGNDKGPVLKAFLHRPFAVFGNGYRLAFCQTAQNGKHQFTLH